MPLFLIPVISWLGKIGAKAWLYIGIISGAVALFFTEYEAVEDKGAAKVRAQDALQVAKTDATTAVIQQKMIQAAVDRPATAAALEAKLDKGTF